MKCDYCNEKTTAIITFPHPNGEVKVMCFACIDNMESESLRAKGEPLKKEVGRKDCLSKDL